MRLFRSALALAALVAVSYAASSFLDVGPLAAIGIGLSAALPLFGPHAYSGLALVGALALSLIGTPVLDHAVLGPVVLTGLVILGVLTLPGLGVPGFRGGSAGRALQRPGFLVALLALGTVASLAA